MRGILAVSLGALLLVASGTEAVTPRHQALMYKRALFPGELWNDVPIPAANNSARADTNWYGDYEIRSGVYYARTSTNKNEVLWTFDRGNGPQHSNPYAPYYDPDWNRIENGEGWYARDLTANDLLYFRVIDNTLNLGYGVPPPIISGQRSLWVGADRDQADAFCWRCGAGYGNNWCQRVVSEELHYNGNGDLVLSFKYFNKSEPCYDGTQLYLKRQDNSELLLNAYVDPCPGNPAWENHGGFTDSIGSYQEPAQFTRSISHEDIGEEQDIRIVVEFSSDPSWSDEDCEYGTTWGPFGLDDLTINGGGINASFDFEGGLGSWSAGFCDPKGHGVDVVDVGCYTILDPGPCRLYGNILEMHQNTCDEGVHPNGQHCWIESPICDLGNADLKTIFMEFDMAAALPLDDGVQIRPGWRYYPWLCEVTGATTWSPRVGQQLYDYFGSDWSCDRWLYGGTEVQEGTPVPPNAEKVVAIIELMSDCAAFSITNCSGFTNPTPLFDNIVVGQTAGVAAPRIAFDPGTQFQDVGSYPQDDFDPIAPGPCDVSLDIYGDREDMPDVAGDSLVIVGALPGADPNSRWEARLWFRVARRAPFQADRMNGQDSRYKIWKARVSDGRKIDRPVKPEFAFGWMDSVQEGTYALRNKFQSSFRENDDDYVGELNPENEILWDDVFFPGTRIDYYVTSNYVPTPNVLYYFPDTTGGHFFEMEVLPGLRTAYAPGCGGTGINYCVVVPTTLYLDVCNTGEQLYVENTLRTVLNSLPWCADEAGCTIPKDRNWDRYDYLNASSNFAVPFARGADRRRSKNGMTLKQIFQYRTTLIEMGNKVAGLMQGKDWELLEDWIKGEICSFLHVPNIFLPVFGDNVGEIISRYPAGQSFLQFAFGARVTCEAFNGTVQQGDCGYLEPAQCVQLLPEPDGSFGRLFEVDAFGNGQPRWHRFDVLAPVGQYAKGNRYYEADGGFFKRMHCAQVTNERFWGTTKTVLTGVSLLHMTKRNSGAPEDQRCPEDLTARVQGAGGELTAALAWDYGIAIPDFPNFPNVFKLLKVDSLAICQGNWPLPGEIDDGTDGSALVTRLYQGEPNPFNPQTTLKFSLAQNGPVRILIYDVGGRLVRTLLDTRMEAGVHEVVWDGVNDQGARVSSGIYWVQMKAGAYLSNKKLALLK